MEIESLRFNPHHNVRNYQMLGRDSSCNFMIDYPSSDINNKEPIILVANTECEWYTKETIENSDADQITSFSYTDKSQKLEFDFGLKNIYHIKINDIKFMIKYMGINDLMINGVPYPEIIFHVEYE